jgi:molecular chaperone GrpE
MRRIAINIVHKSFLPINHEAHKPLAVAYLKKTSRYFSTENNENSTEKKAEPEGLPAQKSPEQELIEKLQGEVKSLKDDYLRSLAEQENVRRIARRDVEKERDYAITKFAKSLLEVADTLGMAISIDTSKLSPEKAYEALRDGVVGTEKNMQKTFEMNGLKRYGAVGDTFDPNLHEALFEVPDPSKPAGTIAQIIKPGYKLKDRVVRAAEVGTYKSN